MSLQSAPRYDPEAVYRAAPHLSVQEQFEIGQFAIRPRAQQIRDVFEELQAGRQFSGCPRSLHTQAPSILPPHLPWDEY